jgi:hypothetical protein
MDDGGHHFKVVDQRVGEQSADDHYALEDEWSA